jgi:plasmid replication initiation protein
LSISPQYFELEGGLERRLYQLARKHVGRQRQWKIGLPLLAQKVGSAQELRFFKRDLKRIIEADNIPDYRFAVNGESNIEVSPEASDAGFVLKNVPNDRLMVIVTPKSKRLAASDD